MILQNAIAPTASEPWYKLFDALQYVTNKYALLAYLFLTVIVAMSFVKIDPKIRGYIFAVLAVMIVVMIFLLLNGSLKDVEDKSKIHLVNVNNQGMPVQITPRVRVALTDTTSLEGKAKEDQPERSGHQFNKTLPQYVMKRIMDRVNVTDHTVEQIYNMTQEDWDRFLKRLGEQDADKVKDVSFARFEILLDGKEVQELSGKWYFKGDEVAVPLGNNQQVKFQIVNIYNTKNLTSGEPEAVNIKLQ